MATLTGKTVALLVAQGFEQIELAEPKAALERAGATARIVSPARDEVEGWNHFVPGDRFKVDVPLAEADAQAFDALVLPGGVANPDQLRMLPQAVQFVRSFFDADKPVAVICHGPWTLIDAGVVRGRTLTSWPSLKTDLVNAGANWVDKEVVVDRGLISSRKPADLPAFNREMIEQFAKAGQSQPAASRRPERRPPSSTSRH
jgi:protease I